MPDPLAIAVRCEEVDGVNPLNDSSRLVIAGEREGVVVTRPHGFAILDDHDETILVAVEPEGRRRGIGSALLLDALDRRPEHSAWAFGTLPAARALAEHLGLRPVRELLHMGRSLTAATPAAPPEGVHIGTFTDADATAVVAVNRAAFRNHPEQGRLDLDGFRALTRQPWFDPAGLLTARIEGQLVGFHWTKRHDATTGEVYVLAVDPAFEGRGIGRALLDHGLAHLTAVGCRTVELYVEADQPRVVALYRASGFDTLSVDTNYRREPS
ncbi:mycothiol synthase [Arachnia propionica]|nr:mycothiol synthase [Arachnia propionica]